MTTLVPVRLADLRYGEEFTTTLTRSRGVVVDTGWFPWDDGTGRLVRVRSVLVRIASVEKILRAEQAVLVPADRPHARFPKSDEDQRWGTRLAEPGSMATLGAVARRNAVKAASHKTPPGCEKRRRPAC